MFNKSLLNNFAFQDIKNLEGRCGQTSLWTEATQYTFSQQHGHLLPCVCFSKFYF